MYEGESDGSDLGKKYHGPGTALLMIVDHFQQTDGGG